MTKVSRILTILVLAVIPSFLAAQFTAPEVARRDFWESYLAEADITRAEAAGEGVTKPFRLYLKKDGTETRGFWKNVQERLPNGALDAWRYEIAAYRLDKMIGLNMIPPVVERLFQGTPGDLSLFATAKFSLLKVMDDAIPIPPAATEAINKMKYLTRAFDCLIANDDRTQQNILLTEDWRTILIDHSRAFRSDPEHTQRLIYGQNGFKTASGRPMLFRQLPRSFVQAVRSLDAAKVKAAVGPYLTEEEIAAVMARREILLAEIDGLIKEKGEASVLY
ncbi:MAG: hypothetical protein MUP19_09860 [Candidatus Aminicenantes bacterium]|nr:hypothetical protein [Candidatus Aminicenantes bacterium]